LRNKWQALEMALEGSFLALMGQVSQDMFSMWLTRMVLLDSLMGKLGGQQISVISKLCNY
jgi:hypothetical protein